MKIRRLSASDASAFRDLRLIALLDTPEAFVSSHVEEADLPLNASRPTRSACTASRATTCRCTCASLQRAGKPARQSSP